MAIATAVTLKDKEKWLKVLKIEMMSSEDFDQIQNNDDIIVKPLEWTSGIVNRSLKKLNEKASELTSPQAKTEESSKRDVPKQLPSWAITTTAAAS